MAFNNKLTFRVKDTEENFFERIKDAVEPELVEAGIEPKQVEVSGIHVEKPSSMGDVEIAIKPR